MRREDAVMISAEEEAKFYYIDQAINYLIDCYNKGKNVYYDHHNVRLYSCDGYTYDEYYVLAMGIFPQEKKHLDALVHGGDRNHEEVVKLFHLTMPVYNYLRELNQPLREKLISGNTKKI